MEEKEVFIAVAEEYYGIGESLEEAYVNLKKDYGSNYILEPDEIEFYQAKKLKVKFKFEIVYE